MNQPTHAWLAVCAYKILQDYYSEKGSKFNLQLLLDILGSNLHHVVVGAWIPDALIKDMTYGHVFKNSLYTGSQTKRFTMSKDELKAKLATQSMIGKRCFH